MQGKVIRHTTIHNQVTGTVFLLRLRRLGRHRFIVYIVSTTTGQFRERLYTNMTEAHAKFIKIQLKAEARNHANKNA